MMPMRVFPVIYFRMYFDNILMMRTHLSFAYVYLALIAVQVCILMYQGRVFEGILQRLSMGVKGRIYFVQFTIS